MRTTIKVPWEQYIQTRRLSANNQIAIPKHILERFNIRKGQLIRIVARKDGRIILTPIKKIKHDTKND